MDQNIADLLRDAFSGKNNSVIGFLKFVELILTLFLVKRAKGRSSGEPLKVL